MEEYPRPLVFVSHSGPDTWVAKQIAREIHLRGAAPFLDEAHVHAGADFEEGILSALERAHELVVLLTPWALDRPWYPERSRDRQGAVCWPKSPKSPKRLSTRALACALLKRRDLLQLNDIELYLDQLAERVRPQG